MGPHLEIWAHNHKYYSSVTMLLLSQSALFSSGLHGKPSMLHNDNIVFLYSAIMQGFFQNHTSTGSKHPASLTTLGK